MPGVPSFPRRRAARPAAAAGVVAVVLFVPVGVAAGAQHSSSPAGMTLSGGCRGQATSLRSDGAVLDEALAPRAPGAASSHALRVARTGRIAWSGSTPVAFTNERWWVRVDGFPVRSGGSANLSRSTSASGVLKLDASIPSWLGVTGLYDVSGEISGTQGRCSGAIFVQLTGDPATGVLLWAGIGFVLFGLALLMGARPSWAATLRVLPTGSVVKTRPRPRAPAATPTGSVVKTRPRPRAPAATRPSTRSPSTRGGGS